MAKQQKAKTDRIRRRGMNRTETRADALGRAIHALPASVRVVARKSTHGHGEVRVEVGPGGGVLVVSKDHKLPMHDEESAMAWLDNL